MEIYLWMPFHQWSNEYNNRNEWCTMEMDINEGCSKHWDCMCVDMAYKFVLLFILTLNV